MLGENIRNLRKENKISQEELAEKLGVSRQSISLWENGQTQPTIENIIAIADLFGVSTDNILKVKTIESDIITSDDDIIEVVSNKKCFLKLKLTYLWIAISIIVFSLIGVMFGNYGSNDILNGEELEKLSNSVFKIEVYDEWGNSIATGSAFAGLAEQTLITNYHVIEKAYSVKAFAEDGTEFDVEYIVQYDKNKDLAILQVDEENIDLPILKFADTKKIKKGDRVYAIGSPLGLKNTISEGVISGILEEDGVNYYQTTAPISSGSSGGVLIDSKGKVIGVTSAYYDGGQNLNFAVSILHVNELYDEKTTPILVEEFAEKMDASGMAPQNVGMFSNVASSTNYIFHSFSKNGVIKRIDKETGENISLGFAGNYINVIENKLYYINDNKIYTSTLDGKNVTEIKFTLNEYENPCIGDLYAIKKGLLFSCFEENEYHSTFSYYMLPYNSKKPINMGNIPKTALFTNDGYYTTEGGYLLIYNFEEPDLVTTCFVNVDLDPYNVYYENGIVVYVINNTVYAMDIVTGQVKTVYTTKNGTIKLRAVYGEYIYFNIKSGSQIPITTNSPLYVMSMDGVPVEICKGLYPTAMNFANDKLFFTDGMGTTPEDKRYSYMCGLDGSELTKID